MNRGFFSFISTALFSFAVSLVPSEVLPSDFTFTCPAFDSATSEAVFVFEMSLYFSAFEIIVRGA